MIYKYDNKFINFENIHWMELQDITFDGDKALLLKICFEDNVRIEIREVVKHKKGLDEKYYVSEYPLEKLRRVPNAWLRWKNNKNIVIDRTITKNGNIETIKETIKGE